MVAQYIPTRPIMDLCEAICSEVGSLGLLEVMVAGGNLLRRGEGKSGDGVRQRGLEVRIGSGAGGDDVQDLKSRNTKIFILTQ